MLSSANFLDTRHATPTGPGSTGAIQPFPCILPRQCHGQLQPPTAPWLPPPRSWVVLGTGLAHRRCGHKTKTGQRGKSYRIPHKTPLFPGSRGKTSCGFFFLGSASDSHDTFSQSGSSELGFFNLNHLMKFYVRNAHSCPSIFPKASILMSCFWASLAF